MENTISLPQFTETPIFTDYYYRALRNDDIDTIDQYTIELIEYIDMEEIELAQMEGYFMTLRDQYKAWTNRIMDYDFSERMEYDSMINEQEFDRIDKQLTSQDRIDMGIDTDLPF